MVCRHSVTPQENTPVTQVLICSCSRGADGITCSSAPLAAIRRKQTPGRNQLLGNSSEIEWEVAARGPGCSPWDHRALSRALADS